MTGGIIGLVGIQKKSAVYLNVFRGLKLAQILLAVVGALLVLLNLDEIASQVTDETIADILDEAKQKHEEPPVIDRNGILRAVTLMLRILNFGSVAFWLIVGGYVLFLIHSVYKWFSEGVDVEQPEIIIMLPPRSHDNDQTSRVQYATPLLQGQTPSIPVRIS